MPLTLADLRAKQFTTVRLREGYDESEVDDFLDIVEAELTRLLRENENLRTSLTSALPRPTATTPDTGTDSPALASPRPDPDSTDGAGRVLELAQQVADQAVAAARTEAEAEAENIVATARMRAGVIERGARAAADALERDSRARAQAVIGDLEATRTGLEARIEDLRVVERNHHNRLKTYLEQQLRALPAPAADSAPTPASDPAPLSALHLVHAGPPADRAPTAAGSEEVTATTALRQPAGTPIPSPLLKRITATTHRGTTHASAVH
ncbi:DivIVA domain-containing protein [Kitasatospora sp. NPDC088346]|uniref:DivIVA domain-containing protein n=1 Tax=Kitasatospora sp. NPDC088346 TaxID=3364073 RepID=UPI003825227A